MGLVHNNDEQGRHEGYAVGYVPRDCEPNAGTRKNGWPLVELEAYDEHYPLREVGSRGIDHKWAIAGVRFYAAGCSCGWRSPRHRVFTTATWWPSVLEFDQNTIEAGFCRDKIERLWAEHVDVELRESSAGNSGR